MIINEIFESIDGESRRAGELTTFVRTNLCNLRCKWCDTKYSWGEEGGTEMTVDEIVAKCKEFGHHNITFTGGEPLIQKDADELITKLVDEKFNVCIETNGATDWTNRKWFIPEFGDENNPLLDRMATALTAWHNGPMAWVCADFKCPSSGETDKMLPIEKFATLRHYDVLKFVVASREELELAYSMVQKLREMHCDCWVYLSPVFGKIEPREIPEFMLEKKWDYKVRAQLQLHKFFWDPNKRGV